MDNAVLTEHWKVSTEPAVLESIHDHHINIAIYQRDIGPLEDEVKLLLEEGVDFGASGEPESILSHISKAFSSERYGLFTKDVKDLFEQFSLITKANSFRVLIMSTDSDMCRKFHTDINSLRMLCTYSGAGTLWLKEEDTDNETLECTAESEQALLEQDKIQQAKIGSAVILKGALYPSTGSKAIYHRSPSVSTGGVKRLLLRIDATGTISFDI